jgi:hypothetical protein
MISMRANLLLPIFAPVVALAAASAVQAQDNDAEMTVAEKVDEATDCAAVYALVSGFMSADEDADPAQIAALDSSGKRWLSYAGETAPGTLEAILEDFDARAMALTDEMVAATAAGEEAGEIRALFEACRAAEQRVFGNTYRDWETE